MIILASVVVFGNQLTPLGAAGSAIAIFGTLLYSLAKNHFVRAASVAIRRVGAPCEAVLAWKWGGTLRLPSSASLPSCPLFSVAVA